VATWPKFIVASIIPQRVNDAELAKPVAPAGLKEKPSQPARDILLLVKDLLSCEGKADISHG
jgi:hypothetical protein